MLDQNTTNNCSKCNRKAKYTFDGGYYCKEHYIQEKYGTDDVHKYLRLKKIHHMHHTHDNHIIINNKNKDVIEMCVLLNIEYWFGIGKIGSTDLSDAMHISIKEE